MIQIAHRGNLEGSNAALENDPQYVDSALDQGFHAEVDLWVVPAGLFLGHDLGNYPITINWLHERADKLWIHCKNLLALKELVAYKNLNYFWHQTDDFTLTSKGFIWTFPYKPTCEKSVIVNLGPSQSISPECYGVCTDYPDTIKT